VFGDAFWTLYPTILINFLRRLSKISLPSQLRTLFYILQKATFQDESVQQTGFVFMEYISGYDLYTHFDRLLTKTQMMLLSECFPAELKAFHVFAGSSGVWAVDLIMPVIKQLAGKHIRLRMVCHSGRESLSAFCKTYNFHSSDMSVIIGGEFTYARFMSWLEQESLNEQAERLCRLQKERSGSDDDDDDESLSLSSRDASFLSPKKQKGGLLASNSSLPDLFYSSMNFSISGAPRAA
jgi:hypothetical protein